MRVKLEAENFNLDLTLKPSFVSSLYRRVDEKYWVKIAGRLGGQLSFKQVSPSSIEVRSTARIRKKELEEIALIETGLWHEPFENLLHSLPRNIRQKVERLSDVYAGVRLPVAQKDIPLIIVSVSLSKRAGYRFVLNWCDRIWRKYDGRIGELAKASLKELREIGTSYQVINLKRTLRDFIEIPRRIDLLPSPLNFIARRERTTEEILSRVDPWISRLILLNLCWGLGPKAADSIILSTRKAPEFIPCDIHLRTVATRLRLISEKDLMPRKELCSKYVCDEKAGSDYGIALCPVMKECMRSHLAYLGELGGWFQTLSYLHGSSFCKARAPDCAKCPMKEFCGYP